VLTVSGLANWEYIPWPSRILQGRTSLASWTRPRRRAKRDPGYGPLIALNFKSAYSSRGRNWRRSNGGSTLTCPSFVPFSPSVLFAAHLVVIKRRQSGSRTSPSSRILEILGGAGSLQRFRMLQKRGEDEGAISRSTADSCLSELAPRHVRLPDFRQRRRDARETGRPAGQDTPGALTQSP